MFNDLNPENFVAVQKCQKIGNKSFRVNVHMS